MVVWPTFVLDLANNHGGSYEKGIAIIDEMAEVVERHGVVAALKLQMRDVLAHSHGDLAYRQKFTDSTLTWEAYDGLRSHAHYRGLYTMCTAFDPSAAARLGNFQCLKVASCSAKDWPLIERLAEYGKPVVFSTAGLDWDAVDNIVSFAEHRALEFALMHCVAIYPMPTDKANLRRIAQMKARYPGVAIGWSTHESPSDEGCTMFGAYAHGARIFETHVGHTNAYSLSGPDLDRWIENYIVAAEMDVGPCGGQDELDALARVERKDVGRDPAAYAHPLRKHIHRTKGILAEAKIGLPVTFTMEFSHHYGQFRFEEYGAVLFTLVNRDYCKKIIVQQKFQSHPLHYHRIKEETFQVLSGKLLLQVDGRDQVLGPGDLITVMPGQWHKFMSLEDTVFEEVSTKSIANDSYYRDPIITQNRNRKTTVQNWGRFDL